MKRSYKLALQVLILHGGGGGGGGGDGDEVTSRDLK